MRYFTPREVASWTLNPQGLCNEGSCGALPKAARTSTYGVSFDVICIPIPHLRLKGMDWEFPDKSDNPSLLYRASRRVRGNGRMATDIAYPSHFLDKPPVLLRTYGRTSTYGPLRSFQRQLHACLCYHWIASAHSLPCEEHFGVILLEPYQRSTELPQLGN